MTALAGWTDLRSSISAATPGGWSTPAGWYSPISGWLFHRQEHRLATAQKNVTLPMARSNASISLMVVAVTLLAPVNRAHSGLGGPRFNFALSGSDGMDGDEIRTSV